MRLEGAIAERAARTRKTRTRGRSWGLALAGGLLTIAQPAKAADERPVRSFGIGPAAGIYSGVGAALLVRAAPIGLLLSGGYMPLLIVGNDFTSDTVRLNYYSSAQLNADLAIGPLLRQAKTDLSLSLGYRYNTVLGHGVGAGIAIELWLSKSVAATVLVGPTIFPSAQSSLYDHGYPINRDAALPWLQGGAGVALSFYP